MEDVEDIYELSPMQHGMLFDSVTAADSGMYLIQLDYFLEGELRADELARAWQATLDRHAVLRTSFHWDDMEKPLQVVRRSATIEVPFDDWSALSADEQEARFAAHREADRERGVDFEEPPLMRLALFRTGAATHRLLWSFHHILMEGWSASMVLGEVFRRYRHSVHGAELVLDEHRPYRDYVDWFQAQDPARAEQYWKNELAGFRTPTHLAVDRAQTTVHRPVTRFDGRTIELEADETAALNAFAKTHGLTLNTLVQGAWALMLSRHADTTDVVFGTIVSGRSVPLEGVEKIVGLFVNLLPSRVDVSPDQELVPWLQALQARQVRQRELEHSPLVQVKGWSEVPAGLPLFESLLVFENWLGDLASADPDETLRVRDVHGHHGAPGYPLTAVVVPAERLTIGIPYDLERFDEDTIERILGQVAVLLRGMVADPSRTLARLALMSEAERDRILLEWSDGGPAFEADPVHEQIARRAAATPDAVAVSFGDTELTYRELVERANRLANHLRSVGAAEHARVGLCMERDVAMVVAMLGILGAGCAYVPLDPAYPAERLRFLLEDSAVPVLVTQSSLAARLRELGVSGPTLVSVDGDADAIAAAPPTAPGVRVTPDHLAYMIYTSGSTGNPKGVMIGHRALANYVAHAARAFSVAPDDRMLQFASISFDTAAEEIYPTLVSGARLVLRNDEMLGSVDDFLGACRDLGITIVDFPTAYWHMLADGLADAETPVPESLRFAILGGERAKPEHLFRWYRCVGERPVIYNSYGPTEATIVAVACELSMPDGLTDDLPADALPDVPIGRPVSGVQAYVLDRHGEPTPVGVPGELHLSGAGLANGYFGRPALTADRFVPNPFSEEPGARMYRTGDLVAFRPDGNLEFVGRRDTQVKFRGYRIELEEIEATLQKLAGVAEAVVLLREDSPGVERVVAYVVRKDPAPTAGDLKRALAERLPAYMVPTATVFLEALPLNAHGKVDRAALPVPDRSRTRRDSSFTAPRTTIETQVAGIWKSVLEVERVGVHDNFFDLGGHSLLLMPVIGALKKELGVKLTPGELVLPTLGQLAALCEERMRDPESAKSEGLVKRLIGGLRTLSFVRGGEPR